MSNKTDLLVDLDVILDTRLVVLYDISDTITEDVIKDKSYFNRLIDVFKDIPQDMFIPLYNNRNKTILSNAIPTNMVNFILEYFITVKTNLDLGLSVDTITLYINIYPYKLTKEEIDNLQYGMYKLFKEDLNIVIINKNNTELTSEWVDSNVSAIIKYDGLEWLETQVNIGDFMNNSMLDTTLFVPTLFIGDINITNISNNELSDLFNKLEESYKSIINLKFMNTSHFCISM